MTVMPRAATASRFWGITSYFNPFGFGRRRANYREFRAALEIPLLSVEWSATGRFELDETDAETLVRLSSPDLMWQKERLLNIALRALPDHVDRVAWLDCDVMFRTPGWSAAAVRELETHDVVQLFSRCVYLGPDAAEEDTAPSLVHLDRQLRDEGDRYRQLWGKLAPGAPRRDRLAGLAWAGRRELLERHGFYDACIFGAGDRAFACTVFGQHRGAEQAWLRTPQQRSHYLAWADGVAADVAGRVGLVEGDLLHLWHGTLEDRQHRVRHQVAEEHGFDPGTDIAVDPQTGLWRWATPKHALHRAVAEFFRRRREDGDPL
ncbi:MAG: hypothetical protein L6Q95_09755 [Planctomycetes bacterium]|nr:hypothetical protein [Planctomycetota bacterium]